MIISELDKFLSFPFDWKVKPTFWSWLDSKYIKQISKVPYQRVNPWLPHDWEKEHTFDDVFLRIQGDYGQVACKASKTGQKIYLYFENVGIEFSFTFEPPSSPYLIASYL